MKAAGKVAPQDFAGICGIYWEGSAWYDVLPADCATQGDVDLGKLCPVYACAQERGVAHCGMCSDFPCYLLVNLAAQTGGNDTDRRQRYPHRVRRAPHRDGRQAVGRVGPEREDLDYRLLPAAQPAGPAGLERSGSGLHPAPATPGRGGAIDAVRAPPVQPAHDNRARGPLCCV